MSPEERLASLGVRQLSQLAVVARDNRNPPPVGKKFEAGGDATSRSFRFERWEEIKFDFDEEYLVDGVLPKLGVGLLYGASQTFKSFVATHMGLCLALKRIWAGRQTKHATVLYLAAEGAAGLRKRKEGYIKAGHAPADGVDFMLLSAAPNLGTASGDYEKLVAAIEAANIKPGLVVVDTVAKVIGGADENGAGMAQFLVTAEALAQHFGCFVLAIHHTGWGEEAQSRPRGWSGLTAALDVQILCERKTGEMVATVTIQKLKDEPSGVRLTAHLERVVLSVSKTGREVSTLIVDDVTEAEVLGSVPKKESTAKSARLLMAAIVEAIDDHGEIIRPSGSSGPPVRAVAERHVRDLYFKRIAEKAEPDEDAAKLYDRQRNGLKRALKNVIDSQALIATDNKGERFLWLP
jgi:hypothetical protein